MSVLLALMLSLQFGCMDSGLESQFDVLLTTSSHCGAPAFRLSTEHVPSSDFEDKT